jgi:hypothetical protein
LFYALERNIVVQGDIALASSGVRTLP